MTELNFLVNYPFKQRVRFSIYVSSSKHKSNKL